MAITNHYHTTLTEGDIARLCFHVINEAETSQRSGEKHYRSMKLTPYHTRALRAVRRFSLWRIPPRKALDIRHRQSSGHSPCAGSRSQRACRFAARVGECRTHIMRPAGAPYSRKTIVHEPPCNVAHTRRWPRACFLTNICSLLS